ncbi:MAG TPA: hypothetical protein VNU84_01835 [Candidatus Acidoferrum sp.]|jgi:hypothetical protein|nr:hypothetical protein [Candidatus Acidoferrum sp.]
MVCASFCLCALPGAAAQDDADASVEEVVVNQAAGRVIVAVVKNAILIATIENPVEAGTRPPIPVALSGLRAGTILGADEWTSPSLQTILGRLDQDLPQLHAAIGEQGPRLSVGAAGAEASDIEAVGKPLRERLAGLAGDIHSPLNWPEKEPVLELVIADILEGYGPEVWQVSYTMSQQQQQGDYWVTNIEDPVYLQIWPPEKGDPHTLMEFSYPFDKAPASLLDLLRRKDPRFDGLLHGDAKMADTANKFLSGDSTKIAAGDATQFLRAALASITPPNARQTMAVIREQTGFEYILAPPAEPKAPRMSQPNRPADAPSLAHPSGDGASDAPSLAHPPGSR